MTRKLSLTCILVLLAALFVTIPALAEKSYYVERFDVHIDIQEDGSAIITETVEFHFSGDPFTYAFREISGTETDGLTFLDASLDGTPMSQGTQAGQVEVEGGNPLKVTWHFFPTSDAVHVLVVRYRADGVIRTGDADALIWRAIPEDHAYSIAHSMITLAYPSKATLLEQPTLSREFESSSTENRLILTHGGLAENEDLILTARFARNSLTQAAPQWQIKQEQTAAVTARAVPVGFISAIVTLILGVLGFSAYTRANSREQTISPVVATSTPPSDLSPAIVGKLTGQHHTFMGPLFDLAQRGVLEIHEENGLWGTKKHILERKPSMLVLKPYEQSLLDILFRSGEAQINMSDIPTRLASKKNLFDDSLEQELLQHGWLDPERKQKRTTLLATGFIAMFFVMGLFVAALVIGGLPGSNINLAVLFAGLAGTSVGVFVLSIALLIYAGLFSVMTPAGEEQAARWKGFAAYLEQVSKGNAPAIRPDYFERYLAYASVFGLGSHWAKYFQSRGGVPLPIWFHATAGGEADFSAMVAVMASSDTAGAGGDGGASAGASGGGSSGAG